VTIDVGQLPPTQSLLLEVLAARYRCGETLWTFESRFRWHLLALADAGLVSLMHGVEAKTVRARLTEEGKAASLSLSYNLPVPTLATAISTLPRTDEQYLAWMRKHQLGHGAGIGTVISAVRADLLRLAGER
jgi:hypothetical protein